jgi:hypothetical protein
MNPHFIATPSWSTASFGDTADTSPMELAGLREHLDLCRESYSGMFAWQCVAQTMRGFMDARFITTLVVVAVLIGIGCLLL